MGEVFPFFLCSSGFPLKSKVTKDRQRLPPHVAVSSSWVLLGGTFIVFGAFSTSVGTALWHMRLIVWLFLGSGTRVLLMEDRANYKVWQQQQLGPARSPPLFFGELLNRKSGRLLSPLTSPFLCLFFQYFCVFFSLVLLCWNVKTFTTLPASLPRKKLSCCL